MIQPSWSPQPRPLSNSLGLGSDLILNSLCALSAPCWVPGTLDTLAWSHGHTAAGSVAAVPGCICAALQDVPIHTLTAGRHCRLLQARGRASSRLQIENNFLPPPHSPPRPAAAAADMKMCLRRHILAKLAPLLGPGLPSAGINTGDE